MGDQPGQTQVQGRPARLVPNPVLGCLDGLLGRCGVDARLLCSSFPSSMDVEAEEVEALVDVVVEILANAQTARATIGTGTDDEERLRPDLAGPRPSADPGSS